MCDVEFGGVVAVVVVVLIGGVVGGANGKRVMFANI